MTSSNNGGAIQDIFWKLIGTKSDKSKIETEVWRLRIGNAHAVSLNTPSDHALLPSATAPKFNFDSNCNLSFKLEISPLNKFSDPSKVKSFTFTSRDPNVEVTLDKILSSSQWSLVKKLIGTGTGYFRIRAWDGIKRETISEVRTFTIQ